MTVVSSPSITAGERAAGRDLSAPSTSRARKRRISRTLKAWAFLLPTFIFVGVFAYWPVVRALEGAFTTWDGVSAPIWTGLHNFDQMLHDSVFLASFEHWFWWSVLGIPVGIAASLLVAILIYRLQSKRAQYWFRVAFCLTLCLPGIVGILTWQNFYEIGGVVDVVLKDIGLGRFDTAWLANPHTALGSLIFLGFPWVAAFSMLVFYAGLQAIPNEILDAARVDGVSSVMRVFRIELPLIKGQLKVILVLSIIGIGQNILTPLLLTQGGPNNTTWTPALYMYENAFEYAQMGYALAIALVLFVISLVLSVGVMRFLRTDEEKRKKVA